MKRQVFKWSTILCLLCVAVFCAYTYNTLFNTASVPTVPEKEEDLPVVTPPVTTPVEHTSFPKLPFLSPVARGGFMQSLGGSADDTVLSSRIIGKNVFVVGYTHSSDYDFTAEEKSVFVAVLSLYGIVERVTLFSGCTYLSSCTTPTGVALALLTPSGFEVVLLNSALERTTLYQKDGTPEHAQLLLSSSSIYCISSFDSSLYLISINFSTLETLETLVTRDSLSVEGFSFIGDKILFISNNSTSFTLYSYDKNLQKTTEYTPSPQEKCVVQSALPAVFSEGIGFCVSMNRDGLIVCAGLTLSGKKVFSTALTRASYSSVIRTSDGNYLVFCSTDRASSCTVLCSHGDILEQNILALSGFTPVDFLYKGGETILLLQSLYEKSGAVVSLDSSNYSTYLYEFPKTTPSSLLLLSSGEIVLTLTAEEDAPSFGASRGGEECFILSLS